MLSIVIPALNEERYLGACLASLATQKTSRPFEVILVDNGSTDGTVEIAKTFSQTLKLRIIEEARRGRGQARKTGFAAATGDIILSTDADTVLPPNWVEEFAGALDSGNYAAATGAAILVDCPPWTNRLFNFFFPWAIRFNRLLYGHVGLSGFGFSIRKNIYDQAGGFDAEADAYEDLDLAMRVHKLGKIALVLSSRPIFSGRRFRNGFFKGWMEYLRTYNEKFVRRKRRVILRVADDDAQKQSESPSV